MSQYEDIQVFLLGESGTGKTSIINRLDKNTFEPEVSHTISITTSRYGLNELEFLISDYSGDRRYSSMHGMHFKKGRVFILVYSITDRYSFEEIEKYWYKEVDNFAEFPLLYVVANKGDLYLESTVSEDEGREAAERINAFFKVISCRTGEGINELFEEIGQKIKNVIDKVGAKQKPIEIQKETVKRQTCCGGSVREVRSRVIETSKKKIPVKSKAWRKEIQVKNKTEVTDKNVKQLNIPTSNLGITIPINNNDKKSKKCCCCCCLSCLCCCCNKNNSDESEEDDESYSLYEK